MNIYEVSKMENTLSIIKPDATKRNITGEINSFIEKSGLKIIAQKRIKLSTELNFTVCDLKGIEKYYVDNVHITHEGNIELAKKFKKTILGLQC